MELNTPLTILNDNPLLAWLLVAYTVAKSLEILILGIAFFFKHAP